MGSDAEDLFIRVTRPLREWLQIGVQWDQERRGLSSPVTERKRETSLDFTYFLSPGRRITWGYEYERIKDRSRNHYLWTSLALSF